MSAWPIVYHKFLAQECSAAVFACSQDGCVVWLACQSVHFIDFWACSTTRTMSTANNIVRSHCCSASCPLAPLTYGSMGTGFLSFFGFLASLAIQNSRHYLTWIKNLLQPYCLPRFITCEFRSCSHLLLSEATTEVHGLVDLTKPRMDFSLKVTTILRPYQIFVIQSE
jgi:hypothetical protein